MAWDAYAEDIGGGYSPNKNYGVFGELNKNEYIACEKSVDRLRTLLEFKKAPKWFRDDFGETLEWWLKGKDNG
jgi:hypothetical protein